MSTRRIEHLLQPLDALWRLCARPAAAIVLLTPLAVLLTLMLILPQAPLTTEPAAFERWLANAQMQHGGWVVPAARIGLLALHSSLLLRLLLAALGAAALVAAADRVLAWRAERGARPFPWLVLAHLGLVLLLLGAVVEERWGWMEEVAIAGGSKAALTSAAAEGFILEWPGQDAALPATVDWQHGMAQGQVTLQPGRPVALLTGCTLHLRRAGPEVAIRLLEPSGQALSLEDPLLGGRALPEASLRFAQAGETRYVTIPGKDWLLRVDCLQVRPEPLLQFTVYAGSVDTPLAESSAGSGGELAVGEQRLRWQVQPYLELSAAFHPGAILWLPAWLLLVTGWAVPAWRERRRPRWPWRALVAWGGTLWATGFGPLLLGGWLARGIAWLWEPWQVLWALGGLLLAGAVHLVRMGL